MVAKTALALCGVGVRLGVRLVLGKGGRYRRTEHDVWHGLLSSFGGVGEIKSRSVGHRETIGTIR